jgi:hypothetical protein
VRRIKASFLYFAIVIGTGFVLGVVRVPYLVPRIGERYAELSEMPIMLVVIVMAARYVVKRFDLSARVAIGLQVGVLALALSVAAELLLAALIQKQSIAQYIASRDRVSGSVYIALLIVFAIMPAMLGLFKRRGYLARH